MVAADRKLPGRAQHPVRHDAADLALAQRLLEGRHPGAGRGPGHEIARRHVAHTDHQLDLAGRVLEPGEAQLVGVRVVADLEHARDDDALEPLPRVQDRLDLDALGGSSARRARRPPCRSARTPAAR